MARMNNQQLLTFPVEMIRHNFLKRTFDIVFSLSVLVIGSPVFFFIGLLIALTSKGRIIYGHERIGRGGTRFLCYKFRTMYEDAGAKLQELILRDPRIKEEWESSYKLKNDPRITPLGKFLRKTSLDELPQFWNVLKGDLSVVGPRPVVLDELQRYFDKRAELILSIRPGLTGLWQVSGRSNVSYEERISLDEEYVKTQSFILDLKLIAKTLPAMLFSKGAY
jgi:exopolysaccharide production protein ExoY